MKRLTKPYGRNLISVVEAYRMRHWRFRDAQMEAIKAFYRGRDGDDGVSDGSCPGRPAWGGPRP